MNNSIPYCNPYLYNSYVVQNGMVPQNRFVYVNPMQNVHQNSTRVLVNPHFQNNPKIVYVNPNFSSNSIHVNPNAEPTSVNKIHINPKVLRTIIPVNNNKSDVSEPIKVAEPERTTLVSTRTKLIRAPVNQSIKRRNSVKSKFKIIKSTPVKSKFSPNRFRLDNRRISSPNITRSKKKFVYMSISDLAKNRVLRNARKSNLVNISGILYKTSPNTLRKAVIPCVPLKKAQNTPKNIKSIYKFVRKSPFKKEVVRERRKSLVTRRKIIRVTKSEKSKISPRKLKKCNIPCPYYRKFGICKGRENGKCNRKHDPAQIALCTKFLQGACINEKCLLSHNVSNEKMPTCKYYLEGSCSKENCPYLHVKISPKADVCRDFLEGFCHKAAECDKRHQFLCPDFEKNGKCLKQRCPYPHGKMVRKYQVNFAKKCSEKKVKKEVKSKDEGSAEIARYYAEKSEVNEEAGCKEIIGRRTRPKLGNLPAFIPC